MRFFTLFPVLLIHVTSVFSVYLKSVELGEVTLEPLENIFSAHLPQYLQPLNLTTGELKLFAGHSFQLIKAKCPAVSQERLALISKYIAKLISRNNPKPGASPAIKDLVTSISTCTAHQITEEERTQREESFFQYFYHPWRSLRNLFGYPSEYTTRGIETTEAPNVIKPTTAPPPETIPINPESEPIQFGEPSSPIRSDSLTDDSQDSSNTPLIRIFYTTSGNGENDEAAAPWSPLGWIGGIFRAIRNIFSGIFLPAGAEEETATSAPAMSSPSVIRVRRDILEAVKPMQENPTEKIELRETEVIERDAPAAPAPLKGREAFLVLIDNLCRIYCSECLEQDQVRNFKAAAKELYQLILTDKTGIELASKHFLEPSFLQSLNQC